MKFLTRTAPYWHGAEGVTRLMLCVLAALLPVLIISTWLLGTGILVNVLWAMLCCVALEALMLALRQRPVKLHISDGSALVTGILIALALPPLVPWWVTATACLFAIVFAKHLYGGIGYNVFNPAMVGYAVVLVSFPQYLSYWPAPEFSAGSEQLLAVFLHGDRSAVMAVDALSSATPLDSIRVQLSEMKTMNEILATPGLGTRTWLWINLSALAGGLWLMYMRVIRWHIPAAMLGSMALLYLLFFALDPAIHPSPTVGLLSGGTMLAAFFIATDPVSAPASNLGRLIYAAGIGCICFMMRQWGAYPDGIAFAVLLMNMAAPLIDRYALPRVYGHRRRP